ncbi:MAG: hypothetical protein JNK63_01290 [Chthonomonas sp.]|nr:hypothetical protein [Chthonomonas sp.]
MKKIALGLVLLVSVASLASGQVLQSEGFESFAIGELDSQSGWMVLPGGNLFFVDPGMATVSSQAAHSGTRSVCLRSDLLTTGESLFAFKPVSPAIGTSNNLVICDFWMSRTGASNANFGGASYSSAGDFLASVTANADAGWVSLSWMGAAPAFITPGNWNRVTMVHNMLSNQVVAFMNGAPLGQFAGNFSVANFSDIDFYADGEGSSVAFFDDLSVEKTGLGVLRGKVDLGDYMASPLGVPITLKLKNPSNGVEVLSIPISLRADGLFSLSTGFRGTYNIEIKPWHWTSKTFTNVSVTDFGAHFLDYAATNGDADNSDEVDAGDIDAVISGFGATGSPNQIAADLDGSGEVDAADIDLAISNFGAVGG